MPTDFAPLHPAEASPEAGRYVLCLYITGATPNSVRAVRHLKELCEQYLPGRYELTVIDIYQQPELAKAERIVATPTLVRRQPLPRRVLIGDLSDRARVLDALDISLPPTA